MGGFEPAPTGKSDCSTFGICRSAKYAVLFAFWSNHNQVENCVQHPQPLKKEEQEQA